MWVVSDVWIFLWLLIFDNTCIKAIKVADGSHRVSLLRPSSHLLLINRVLLWLQLHLLGPSNALLITIGRWTLDTATAWIPSLQRITTVVLNKSVCIVDWMRRVTIISFYHLRPRRVLAVEQTRCQLLGLGRLNWRSGVACWLLPVLVWLLRLQGFRATVGLKHEIVEFGVTLAQVRVLLQVWLSLSICCHL